MKVKKLKIRNIGPIENLDINFQNNKEKPCMPVVFVGLNGSGKSIVLSYIADAFIEFKRQFYNDLDVKEDKYLKWTPMSRPFFVEFKV